MMRRVPAREKPTGALAPHFGWLVGVGPGAGLGLMFIATGLSGALIGFGGYLFRTLCCVEEELPDYDETGETADAEAGYMPETPAAVAQEQTL